MKHPWKGMCWSTATFDVWVMMPPCTDGAAAPTFTYSGPNSFHFLSTSALVFSSIWISSGQGRVKPSLGHLLVASMPIFDP
jgi:hypothetical protein